MSIKVYRNHDNVFIGIFPSDQAYLFVALSRRDAEDWNSGRRPDAGGYTIEPVPPPPGADSGEVGEKDG